MSDKFKNSKFYRTLKNPKVSRAIYISLVLLLVAVAVVIGITAAANRSKRGTTQTPVPGTPSDVTSAQTPVTSVPTPGGTTANTPSGTAGTTAPNSPVVSAIPTFSLPVAGKLAKYHDAKVQVFSTTMNDYRVHLGVDITTAAAAPVYAAADGKVQKIWKDTLMGYSVAVAHSGDSVTIYKNLSDTLPAGITEGATVKAGQQIASVGESAMVEIADEPHLHFEMTVAGLQVDPLEYYSAKDLTALSVDTSYGD